MNKSQKKLKYLLQHRFNLTIISMGENNVAANIHYIITILTNNVVGFLLQNNDTKSFNIHYKFSFCHTIFNLLYMIELYTLV